jgi:5-aminopentanamidase
MQAIERQGALDHGRMRRVAVYQGSAARADKKANLATTAQVAQAASALESDVLVLPEMFLTGYNIGLLAHELAETPDGPSLVEIGDIARRTRCAIVVGFPEWNGTHTFNSAAVFDARGTLLSVYRKIHLFGPEEKKLFSPGEELAIVDLAGCRVGIAICYDIEFPEMARELKRRGAEIVLVPTANMTPYWEIPTTLVRARALENAITVAYANHCGQDGNLDYTGLSGITGPDGMDLVRAGPNTSALLIADLPSPAGLTLSTQLADLRLGEQRQNPDG